MKTIPIINRMMTKNILEGLSSQHVCKVTRVYHWIIATCSLIHLLLLHLSLFVLTVLKGHGRPIRSYLLLQVSPLRHSNLASVETSHSRKLSYYASPSSGDAYSNRQLTPNFELRIEIFVCRHASI